MSCISSYQIYGSIQADHTIFITLQSRNQFTFFLLFNSEILQIRKVRLEVARPAGFLINKYKKSEKQGQQK